MTHSAWWLVLDALAVYRLSVLVTRDLITDGLRKKLGQPWTIKAHDGSHMTRAGSGARYWLWQMCLCPWCVSVWLAVPVLLLTRYWPEGWQYGALLLALSGIAGFLEERR